MDIPADYAVPGSFSEPAFWYIFQGDKIMPVVPFVNFPEEFRTSCLRVLNIGRHEGVRCFAMEVYGENASFLPLRQAYTVLAENLYRWAGIAYHLLAWDDQYRYCAGCRRELKPLVTEQARFCAHCKRAFYPSISPAVIMAVIRKDEILLAQNVRHGREGFYSVLAGYVEPGESLEECVKREVREEVGIQVKNIRYFSSQPWPFAQALMIGFTAEYESGEIQVDQKEIMQAGWFTRHSLPEYPGKYSLAHRLISWFLEGG